MAGTTQAVYYRSHLTAESFDGCVLLWAGCESLARRLGRAFCAGVQGQGSFVGS